MYHHALSLVKYFALPGSSLQGEMEHALPTDHLYHSPIASDRIFIMATKYWKGKLLIKAFNSNLVVKSQSKDKYLF